MKDIKTMTAAELFPHDDLSTWDWLKHVKGYETDGGFRITVFAKGGPPTEYEYMSSDVRFDTQETKWFSKSTCADLESAAKKCLSLPSVVERLISHYESKKSEKTKWQKILTKRNV